MDNTIFTYVRPRTKNYNIGKKVESSRAPQGYCLGKNQKIPLRLNFSLNTEKSTPWRGTGKSTLGTRGSGAMGRSRGHQCPPIRHLGLVSLVYSSKQNDQDYGMSIR